MNGRGEGSGKTVRKLILVNRENPVPPGYQDSVDLVSVAVEENFSVPLQKEAAEKYLQLKRHLSSLGIHVEALSGFRTRETQERIWNESVAAHGEAHARRYVAKPGFSEHQTGLALDVTLYDAHGNQVEDDDVEAYGKLHPHLHEFGFILRYPAGKEDVTGYPFEPWHIRYVGEKAASEMHANGLTLEEYVSRTAFARDGQHDDFGECK